LEKGIVVLKKQDFKRIVERDNTGKGIDIKPENLIQFQQKPLYPSIGL